MWSFISEIFTIKDSVAFSKDLVSFGPQVVLLTQIAHVKQFLVVLLQQTKSRGSYIGEASW